MVTSPLLVTSHKTDNEGREEEDDDPQEEEEEEEEATARHNQTPSSRDSLQQLRVPSSKRCRFPVPPLHRKVP